MASIARDPDGKKRITFTSGDGKRQTIRLGQVTVKSAETFKTHVETLLACRLTNTSIDTETACWLRDLSDVLHDRLARTGLVEPRERKEPPTFARVLDAYFEVTDVSRATITRMEQARHQLEGYFGEDQDMSELTLTDADAWRAALVETGYAEATISRTVRYARQFANWGMKRGMLDSNPFAELRAGSQTNDDRLVFVDRATIEKVIDAAPSAEWRLLIALSRYCGLRVPSEALTLKWGDVDFDKKSLLVRSSKTRRHEGKGSRRVPIFDEILPHLMEVFEQAPEGVEHVISSYRTGTNINPQLRRIIERAGIEPWPRAFHNMRASRQTELARDYPLHTVCAWIGNTKAIAAGHYLQVTDADWQRATGVTKCGAHLAQNPPQHTAASDRTDSHEESQVFGGELGCATRRDGDRSGTNHFNGQRRT